MRLRPSQRPPQPRARSGPSTEMQQVPATPRRRSPTARPPAPVGFAWERRRWLTSSGPLADDRQRHGAVCGGRDRVAVSQGARVEGGRRPANRGVTSAGDDPGGRVPGLADGGDEPRPGPKVARWIATHVEPDQVPPRVARALEGGEDPGG